MRLGAFGTIGGTTTWKWRLGGGVLGVLGPSWNISSYVLAALVAVMAAALVAIATLAAAIISR
jgi:hypothetical protein